MTVLRPEVLPDELAAGYKGRVRRYNGWADEKQAMGALLAWSGHGGASLRTVATVELLARVADLDTASFVRGHTTLPLQRAVVCVRPGVPHGSSEHAAVLRMVALSRAVRK